MAPVCRIETSDLTPERTLVAKIFPRKTGVHDRDRLFLVGIFDSEIAAFENLQPEGS